MLIFAYLTQWFFFFSSIRHVLSEPEGRQGPDEDGFGPGAGGSLELLTGGAGARHRAA